MVTKTTAPAPARTFKYQTFSHTVAASSNAAADIDAWMTSLGAQGWQIIDRQAIVDSNTGTSTINCLCQLASN